MKEDLRSASQSSKGNSVAYTALNFLSTWWQRREFLIVMLLIHTLDHLVSNNLTQSGVLSARGNEIVATFENLGGIVLMILALACLIAIIKPFQRLIIPIVAFYLSLAVVHLVVNVGAVLLTAEMKQGQSLLQLWDVVVVYFMGVFVFTGWYWFLDKVSPGGAFLFPSRPGENPSPDPGGLSFPFLQYQLHLRPHYGNPHELRHQTAHDAPGVLIAGGVDGDFGPSTQRLARLFFSAPRGKSTPGEPIPATRSANFGLCLHECQTVLHGWERLSRHLKPGQKGSGPPWGKE